VKTTQVLNLLTIPSALYLTSKTYLLVNVLQLSDKLIRVYVVFACRESSFCCIIVSHYLAYSDLSISFTVLKIRIDFNLKYEMGLFK
jgi:hypothetical protein